MRQAWKVHLSLLTVNVIYGLNYNIAKLAMPTYVQAFGFVLIRVAVGSLMFLLLQRLLVREGIQREDIPRLVLCGLTGVAANQLLFFKGLSLTSPINASLIMVTVPIMVLVLGGIAIKGSLSWSKIAGVAAGALGAALIILVRGDVHAAHSSLEGDIYILLNAISFATYLVLVKRLMTKYHPLTVVTWVFIFGAIMVLPFGYAEFVATDFAHLPLLVWGSIAFVVLGTTFVAYGLNIYALSKVEPAIVGIYIYLQPLLAGMIAIYLNGEPFTWAKGIAALLIFAGVYLVSRKSKPTPVFE